MRTALALPGAGAPEPGSAAPWRGALHAAAYFGVPLLLVAALGAGRRSPAPEQQRAALAHEAALFPRSATALARYGRAAQAGGDEPAARAALERALALAPTYAGTAAALADLALARGDGDELLRLLRIAAESEPENVDLRYRLGLLLAGQRLLDEAEGHFLAVARRRPEFAGVHVNLGELDKWRDRLSAALEHFRRAHELDPELSPAVCNLAGGLATLGRGGEALGILGEYRRRHPEDEVAERLEGDVRRAFGR